MQLRALVVFCALSGLLAGTAVSANAQQAKMGPQHKAPKTDAEKIRNALSAAPRSIGKDATVIDIDDKGNIRTLRQGKGEFTCIPDDPHTPGNDPMCIDRIGFEWIKAWLGKKEPPAGRIGIGYMLRGGSDASNEDPYAMAPAPGKKWLDTGPHVMILGGTKMMEGTPKHAGDPHKPYIMWPGTPYEHLMLPVK